MTQMISSYNDILKKEFIEIIDKKSSWGKNEIKLAFLEAQVKALSAPPVIESPKEKLYIGYVSDTESGKVFNYLRGSHAEEAAITQEFYKKGISHVRVFPTVDVMQDILTAENVYGANHLD